MIRALQLLNSGLGQRVGEEAAAQSRLPRYSPPSTSRNRPAAAGLCDTMVKMAAGSDFDSLWERSRLSAVARTMSLRATMTRETLARLALEDTALPSEREPPPSLALDATVDASAPGTHPLLPHLADTLPMLPRVELGEARERASELAVLGVLGEGGMGRVLLVRQQSLARDVAVKVLKDSGANAAHAASLLAEARVMGHLEHPGIVPIHALGRDDRGSPVLVMKRVEGVVWSDLLEAPNHPAWASLANASADRRRTHLEVLMAVCNAVHFAHSRGVIHRDLKPDNVMVGAFGEVYVTDWGIAVAMAGAQPVSDDAPMIVGTPVYMAPEMIRGDAGAIDARTDVFLLGAILHQILTGAPRHAGTSLIEVLRAAFSPQPIVYDPPVPAELAAIANKATGAEPSARFATALELRHALADHLRHEGSTELGKAAGDRLEELRRRKEIAADRRIMEDTAAIERLGAECRFGFLEALRSWPENAVARRGLQDCIELVVEDRVGRGDAQGARALAAELDPPSRALIARIEALEAATRQLAAEREKLEALEHDLDPTVASSERTAVMLAGVVAVILAVFVALWRIAPSGKLEQNRLVMIPAAFLAVTLVVAGVTRRRLLANAFNRRAVGILIVALAMIVANRVLGLRSSAPVHAVLRSDLLILATALLGASLTQMRHLAWAAVPLVIAAIFLPQGDRSQLIVFGVAATIAFAISAVVSHAARKAG